MLALGDHADRSRRHVGDVNVVILSVPFGRREGDAPAIAGEVSEFTVYGRLGDNQLFVKTVGGQEIHSDFFVAVRVGCIQQGAAVGGPFERISSGAPGELLRRAACRLDNPELTHTCQ